MGLQLHKEVGQTNKRMTTTPPPPPPPRLSRPPYDGEIIWNNQHVYSLGPEIGAGYFGKVFRCTDRWSNDLVAKVLVPQHDSYDQVRELWSRELGNLIRLRHPHITFVYDAFEYEHSFYLILERCADDLNSLIRLPDFNGELWLPTLARDVLQALEFIHDVGYVHKDLHPGNVFVFAARDRMVPAKHPVYWFKIGDLGISRLESDINVFNTILAKWMLPPEAIDPQQFGSIGRTVDIYHAGLLFLSILLGRVPEFTHEEVVDGAPRKAAEALSSSYAPAIASALRRHVSARPQSAAEFWQLIFDATPASLRPF